MNIIFDSIEVVKKRVRARDPLSSVLAAERSTRFSETHKGRILAALQILGGSATAHEISQSTGLSVVQVDRRLPELERDNLAEVVELAGQDVMRGGFRLWRLKKISAQAQQDVATTTDG